MLAFKLLRHENMTLLKESSLHRTAVPQEEQTGGWKGELKPPKFVPVRARELTQLFRLSQSPPAQNLGVKLGRMGGLVLHGTPGDF